MDGSRRRKSIIVIDKKGNAEEVLKKQPGDKSTVSEKGADNGAKKDEGSHKEESSHKNSNKDESSHKNSNKDESSHKNSNKDESSHKNSNKDESSHRDESSHKDGKKEENNKKEEPSSEKARPVNSVNDKETPSKEKETLKNVVSNTNASDVESKNKSVDTKQTKENKNESSQKNTDINKPKGDEPMIGDVSKNTMKGAAVAAAASSAGYAVHKSKEDSKKVQFSNEKKEYNVAKDPNKSIPLSEEEKVNSDTSHVKSDSLEDVNEGYVPYKIPGSEMADGSSILRGRTDGNIVAEGHFWKRRRIFSCFWHQKYLVLLKNNTLVYHKANGARNPKGNWDMNKAKDIQATYTENAKHPYRLSIELPTGNLLFGFDDKKNRDYWFDEINKIIDKNKGKR